VSAPLAAVVEYLNAYLRVASIADAPEALNGLQVENDGTVTRLAAAVDACQATIAAAAELRADFLLVHHGLFWSGLTPITQRHGRRVRRLIESGIALYSAHLPLDLHAEVGNNVLLARLLGLSDAVPFGDEGGQPVGVVGRLEGPRNEVVARVRTSLAIEPLVIATGPEQVRRVAVITGAGGGFIAAAHAAGADTYVTGEGKHHSYFDAEELGVNVVYAGHYATETLGVKALGAHVHERFGIPWQFVDHPTGL
jgi:dinuclear metal center YbgI/SA1388 family protein